MIIQCSKCGKEIERTKEIDNAICYDCKMKMRRDRHKIKVKTKTNLHEISWEEIKRRVAKINEQNEKKRTAKKYINKSKYQLK